MINLFRTLFPKRRRALEAAAGGRRWKDAPLSFNSASQIHAGAGTVAARASAYVANNPHGARAVSVLESNICGTGIKPQSHHESEAIRTRLHKRFQLWADNADAGSQTGFYGLQASAVRDMVTLGEALFIWTRDPQSSSPQLRRLHPEQLDRSKTAQLQNGHTVYQGVEFNAQSRIVAYWIRPRAPGDSLAGVTFVSSPTPASDVLHIFRPVAPGQVRGLSWFAPVLLAAKELDQLTDALLVRAKTAALFAGMIYDNEGGAGGFEGEKVDDSLLSGLEPGALKLLPSGKNIEFSNPPDSGDAPAFMNAILHQIAAGVGPTFEQITGDYSQINYSSARAALLEFRKFAEGIQQNVIVPQLCRPVWERFLLWQVLHGGIPATSFQANREDYQAVKWIAPGWQQVDPLKAARAAIAEMDAGIRSRAETVNERGHDIEALDVEIAADQARANKLGLDFKEATNVSN